METKSYLDNKKLQKLIVAEVFYSIQGEGPTIGTPAVFLRLAGCNLLCESNHWRCDTIEVWKKGVSMKFEDIISDYYIQFLTAGAHLIITGGEPLLQQMAIVNFLNWFREKYKFTPFIEVETNGTITPLEILFDKIDQWNVSPKLKNSGMPFSKRCEEVVLKKISSNARSKIFKFVISCEEDMIELNEEYDFLQPSDIMLMPAGDSIESLTKTRVLLVNLCKNLVYRFSDRLHISLWNKKTGV